MISLATSKITQEVRDNVNACLDENRIGGGRFIKEFEDNVAQYLGVKHAIAVNNGTMADMVAIAALKAQQPQPNKVEVIVPALTFTAQVASVIHLGLKPVFVDINKYNYQMDLDQVESKINENTLAIMAVHLLGRECDITQLQDIAKRNNIFLMEDCCEAYGGEYGIGGKFGTGSSFGTFSFFPSHTITTGEGGMVVTNDDTCASLARQIMNHGRVSDKITEKFHFSHLGFNGKISNLLASIGCAVAKTADDVIAKRRQNVTYLNDFLDEHWHASSPHCYPIMCKNELERNLKLEFLEQNGVEARKLFSCLPTQEHAYRYLGYKLGDFPVAEEVGQKGLFLPIHQDLTEEDLERICALL